MEVLDIVKSIANFLNPKLLNGVCKTYYELLKNETCIFAQLDYSDKNRKYLYRPDYRPIRYKLKKLNVKNPEEVLKLLCMNRYFKAPKVNRYTIGNFKVLVTFKRNNEWYSLIIPCCTGPSQDYLLDFVMACNLEVQVFYKHIKTYTPQDFVNMAKEQNL